ncbi:hypothetical protein H072_9258 [Dactylellina haptotyla CBS 200.50]|uniref:Uncharacterized protein n=1 Tax=Dactylellina haptotyla (strain CBS 200.50) TaxID=1284197 RepID=S8BPG4_DACHA|nr:hypothetical protein H072_9258 [Dactylellina haptotyla CBS 200.50]
MSKETNKALEDGPQTTYGASRAACSLTLIIASLSAARAPFRSQEQDTPRSLMRYTPALRSRKKAAQEGNWEAKKIEE